MSGGLTSDGKQSHMFYSWAGPGSSWINRCDLPVGKYGHSMIYDGHNDIWCLTGDHCIHVYSLEKNTWRIAQELPGPRWQSGCVCCGAYVVTPGGLEVGKRTNTVLVTNIQTECTVTAATRMPVPIYGHCVALVSTTKL